MVRNEQKYQEALRLRERGFTLSEIATYCEVSKSTVSKWLKNNAMSAAVTATNKRKAGQENAKRLQLMSKTRVRERVHRNKDLLSLAATEFKHFGKDPLFAAGVALYLASGDTVGKHKVRMTNTNIDQHCLFIAFLREYLGISNSQIRLSITLYENQAEEVCLKKWRNRTRLPYQSFYKTQWLPATKQTPLHYGVGNTIIGNTVLQSRLVYWTTLLVKQHAK